MPYGISNVTGQVSQLEVNRILEIAIANGITTIDTAQSYGSSERVLGRSDIGMNEFQIATKVPTMTGSRTVDIRAHVLESLDKLRIDSLYALMFHDSSDLTGHHAEALWESATKLQAEGLVLKLGVSVYDPLEAVGLAAKFGLQLVQLPYNVFDQRALHLGVLALLRQTGVEIHCRSAFLQGVVFMKPEDLPESLAALRPRLTLLHDLANRHEVSVESICLAHVNREEIDRVVVGVESSNQLKRLITAFESDRRDLVNNLAELKCDDENLVNPTHWKLPEQ